MHDGQQVFHQLLLRGQRFLVGDDDLAAMLGRQPLDQLETEPRQPILVGNHHGRHLAGNDVVEHREKLAAAKVHPTADFTDPLGDRQSTSRAEAFHRRDLRSQVVTLSGRGHPAVHHHTSRCGSETRTEHGEYIGLGEVSLTGHRPRRRDQAFPLPAAHCRRGPANPVREFRYPQKITHYRQLYTALSNNKGTSRSSFVSSTQSAGSDRNSERAPPTTEARQSSTSSRYPSTGI